MSDHWRVHVASLDGRFQGIESAARNVYSQFGEDGLIAAIFEKIGIKNRWCFEVGAYDGIWLSNTKTLRDEGWSALLVESNVDHFQRLSLFANDAVKCVNEHVDCSSLDRLLKDAGAPTNLDLGVIDIDGQDYWVWDGMRNYAPRVMMVEFCYRNILDIPPLGDVGTRQATLQPLIELGRSKGYSAVTKSYVNCLFVKDSELV